jgi:hypothetical protein
MGKVFLKQYGKGAEFNANKTLRRDVSIEELTSSIPDPNVRELLEHYQGRDGLRLWGFGYRDSQLGLSAGDILLILLRHEKTLYYSEVAQVIDDESGIIEKAVKWRPFPRNHHWSPVLLTNVSDISGLIGLLLETTKERREKFVERTKVFQLSQ